MNNLQLHWIKRLKGKISDLLGDVLNFEITNLYLSWCLKDVCLWLIIIYLHLNKQPVLHSFCSFSGSILKYLIDTGNANFESFPLKHGFADASS